MSINYSQPVNTTGYIQAISGQLMGNTTVAAGPWVTTTSGSSYSYVDPTSNLITAMNTLALEIIKLRKEVYELKKELKNKDTKEITEQMEKM